MRALFPFLGKAPSLRQSTSTTTFSYIRSAKSQMPGGRPKKNQAFFEGKRDAIFELYINQNKTLDELREHYGPEGQEIRCVANRSRLQNPTEKYLSLRASNPNPHSPPRFYASNCLSNNPSPHHEDTYATTAHAPTRSNSATGPSLKNTSASVPKPSSMIACGSCGRRIRVMRRLSRR